MRIVNKEFHDYYDSCMAHGIDMTIVYDRKMSEFSSEDELTKKSNKFLTNIPTTWYGNDQNSIDEEVRGEKCDCLFESGIVGFCGIIYPFLKVHIREDVDHTYFHETRDEYIFDFDAYLELTRNLKIEKNRILSNTKAIEEYFRRIENIEFFFDIKNPIFMNTRYFINRSYRKDRKLVLNPNLSDIKFYRAVDAMSAFQKISSFLSGVLGGVHPPTSEVSDEVKKHKAGFGHKYAFKKEPTKRKTKRGKK